MLENAIAIHLKKIPADGALMPQPMNDVIGLREKNVMEVEVLNPPSDLTAIAMGRLGRLSGVKVGHWMRNCDYLLTFSRNGKDHAIFVELKKTLNEDGEKAYGETSAVTGVPGVFAFSM